MQIPINKTRKQNNTKNLKKIESELLKNALISFSSLNKKNNL